MFKCISLGVYNHYYKYILLSAFFLFLNFTAFGINYNNSFLELKLFPGEIKRYLENNDMDSFYNGILNNNIINNIIYNDIEVNKYDNLFNDTKQFQKMGNLSEQRQPYFSKHKYIHLIYCYFFTFLFGLVYNYISSKEMRITEYLSSSEKFSKGNNLKSSYFSNRLMLLFIIFLWVIMDFFIDFYNHTLKDLDFWFFELIMISIFSNKMFNFKLYNHQKLAILFNLILSFTKIIILILSFCDPKSDEYLWYASKPFFKVFIGINIYFILILIRSYVNSKIKYYIDKTYISISKLLIFYGFIGTIIFIIICLITTYVECSSLSIFSHSSSSSYNKNYICKVPFNYAVVFGGSKIKLSKYRRIYLENFHLYFRTFLLSNFKEVIKEIIIILYAGITFFYYKYFSLKIIETLSPIHFIFTCNIYYFIKKLILPIYTLINVGSFFIANPIKFILPKYILDMSGDFLSLIALLIFLEIIELNFCGFNKDLRRKIMERSAKESFSLLEFSQRNDSEDDFKEEEEK